MTGNDQISVSAQIGSSIFYSLEIFKPSLPDLNLELPHEDDSFQFPNELLPAALMCP
jgi:hypothetical protein